MFEGSWSAIAGRARARMARKVRTILIALSPKINVIVFAIGFLLSSF